VIDGLILGIETSNPSAASSGAARPGVAVARAGAGLEVLGVEAIDTSRLNEDDLMPAVERLFKRLGIAAKELGAVAVSIGPGGFTAVRLAVTAAKMIAEATGAECLPVPTARAVAQRVEARGRRFGVALSSKGDSAFVTVFEDRAALGAGQLMRAPDLEGLGIQLLVVDQFLPDEMRRRAAELKIEIVPPVFDPLACIEVGLTVQPVDPVELLPLYPREPEAVTKWKKLHPR
jgi:tRNA threonylcarbamoyl adenosine modification protein YeaZ